jgi:hypothetical protein
MHDLQGGYSFSFSNYLALPLPRNVVDHQSLFFLNCLRHVSHSKCQAAWSGGKYSCAVCNEASPVPPAM